MARTIVAAAVAAALTLIGTSLASGDGNWRLLLGDERTYVGSRPATPDTLEIFALAELNLSAAHIRQMALDSNFELESPATFETSRLTGYDLGTPQPKPIEIGGAGQHVTALVVTASRKQRAPLQVWRAGDDEVAAVTARGALRLRDITLSVQLRGRALYLVATTPDGRRQTLRFQR
jgi:hypothetical protein